MSKNPANFRDGKDERGRDQQFQVGGPNLHASWLRRTLGALGRISKKVTKEVRPARESVPTTAIAERLAAQLTQISGVVDASVTVARRFGAATMIEFNLVVDTNLISGETALERAVEICWDNRWLAPVGLRPHARSLPTQSGQVETWNGRSIGFSDTVLYPRELFDRFGAPRADMRWRP